MAHFAELDENNVVTRVIVVNDNDIIDPHTGEEEEILGIAFCKRLLGGNWVQTSYNGNIRKRYAGIGYSYNKSLDAFILPKPHESWILNQETAEWEAPISKPTLTAEEEADNMYYVWDESAYQSDNTTGWVLEEAI